MCLVLARKSESEDKRKGPAVKVFVKLSDRIGISK